MVPDVIIAPWFPNLPHGEKRHRRSKETARESLMLSGDGSGVTVDRRARLDRRHRRSLRGARARLAVSHVARIRIAGPEYYARSLDELWVYRHLFSSAKPWAVGLLGAQASNGDGHRVLPEVGGEPHARSRAGLCARPGIRTPCHETTSLATRGIGDASWTGPKIVFVGDSFVESAACSNDTLTTKVQKLTGIETLNFGVGGYGVDQIFLYWKRLLPQCDRSDCLFLVGVIQDDLGRMLLAVRTSPKPYFTIRDGKLVLHTSHIHPAALNDVFERPPERFYLYYFLRGRLGYPIYRSLLKETQTQRLEIQYALSALIFRRWRPSKRQGPFELAFVVFPTPGNPFDPKVLSLLRGAGIPYVDLQGCLKGEPDADVYAELHPTALGNELLAKCLVRGLTGMGLLKSLGGAR
jgi:hypothetical protein